MNISSDTKDVVRFTVEIDTKENSVTFPLTSTIRGVMMIVIPFPLKRRGIQNVSVFPDPVGARVVLAVLKLH